MTNRKEYSEKRTLLCKVCTITSNQFFERHCSNVIVLLCTAKRQRMQGLIGTLTRTDLMSITVSLTEADQGQLSADCRMKFFVATASGWESLAVVTKKSILVSKDILDLPLIEIKMRKLNRHHNSEREFY